MACTCGAGLPCERNTGEEPDIDQVIDGRSRQATSSRRSGCASAPSMRKTRPRAEPGPDELRICRPDRGRLTLREPPRVQSYSFRSRTQLRSSGSAPPASPEFCASITGPAFSALSSNSIDPHTATSATLRRRAELPEAGVTYVSDQENLN
jgi:hypothetical protein